MGLLQSLHIPVTQSADALVIVNNPNMLRTAGGGVKDVPFFPYAPYLPQTEMGVTGASFSQKRVQLPPVVEEHRQDEEVEMVEDNERVQSLLMLSARHS